MKERRMRVVPEWQHFHLLPFSAGKPVILLVICMAERDKCLMLFQAAEKEPHC